VEDESDTGNSFGPAPSGGGNWKPVSGLGGDNDPKLYIQKGSRMNDGEYDEDAPF
jgi:replicative DNA helicase